MCYGGSETKQLKIGENVFMKESKQKVMAKMNMDVLDQETNRDVERVVILRIATKRINLWIRRLEMKRKRLPSWQGC